MRNQLIGYVVGALEPHEHEQLEQHLAWDANLCKEMELVRRALAPLECDRVSHDPPPGLAATVCDHVAGLRGRQELRPAAAYVEAGSGGHSVARGWSVVDLAVAAGILLAAGVLFFPAVSHSRFNAQLANCQNNLAEIGRALGRFGQQNPLHALPAVTVSNKLSAAGLYAPQLIEQEYVSNPNVFYCGGATTDSGPARIPTLRDLRAAEGDRLQEMLGRAGGSYGYTLGYVEDGRYTPTRLRGKTNFPIMADAPCPKLDFHQSSNHGGYGQNVLFEDGHVRYLTGCGAASGCPDRDFFRNDDGRIAAGKNPDDAVIGCSRAKP